MGKGKDPDPDPGGPKTSGSGSPTLVSGAGIYQCLVSESAMFSLEHRRFPCIEVHRSGGPWRRKKIQIVFHFVEFI